MVPSAIDIRSFFPSLQRETVFFENAGGTQAPRQVVERTADFYGRCNVQLGATYSESEEATRVFSDAHLFMHRQFGGSDRGGTVLGASSSQLLKMLADCYADVLSPGDEIVIAESGHEANINPWLRLERVGVKVVWWRIDPAAQNTTIDGLRKVLSERTRLVVYPHVSNLLGEIADVVGINDLAHSVGAEVVVDGVAYAPHGLMDVETWGCDYYVASIYKIFGPHMAALYGKMSCWEKLDGPNHFFMPRHYFPGKFELGCQNHEGCAGILGVGDYVLESIGEQSARLPTRTDVLQAWRLWSDFEAPLQVQLLDFLTQKDNVRIVGPSKVENRFGIVSFTHKNLSSHSIVEALTNGGIACRNGHMYAFRLCQALGIEPNDGVVRISFAHYNTMDEVEKAVRILEPIL